MGFIDAGKNITPSEHHTYPYLDITLKNTDRFPYEINTEPAVFIPEVHIDTVIAHLTPEKSVELGQYDLMQYDRFINRLPSTRIRLDYSYYDEETETEYGGMFAYIDIPTVAGENNPDNVWLKFKINGYDPDDDYENIGYPVGIIAQPITTDMIECYKYNPDTGQSTRDDNIILETTAVISNGAETLSDGDKFQPVGVYLYGVLYKTFVKAKWKEVNTIHSLNAPTPPWNKSDIQALSNTELAEYYEIVLMDYYNSTQGTQYKPRIVRVSWTGANQLIARITANWVDTLNDVGYAFSINEQCQ